jgi:translation initiation factor 2D
MKSFHQTFVCDVAAPPEVSARLRAAFLQALRTTLADLPSSAFPMPTTTLYTVHILRARAFTQTATTPVDIKHSTFKSLSAFLRTAEKGGLLKLKDARPDVVVVAVYPTHADVVAHRLHRTVGEEESRRRRAEEREAQQAAAAANAGKSMKVTELWKPHLGTLPLFKDLGHE